MNKRIVGFGIITMLTLMSSSWAQVNRYVVYFPDKDNSTFSINSPEAFLSERAIERRLDQEIAIDETDLPVNSWYVDSLEKYDVSVYYTSKWLNAAVVQATVNQMIGLAGKSFVSSYEYVAPGAKLLDNPQPINMEFVDREPEGISSDSYQQLAMLNIHAMHADGFDGSGVWIAVFDAGFEGVNNSSVFKHLFDNDQIKDVHDFTTGGGNVFKTDHDDHGTNVLSCLAGKYENTLVGPAYGSEISLYITEEYRYADEYRIEEYNWLIAAERSDSSGVDIISSSLGYSTFEDSGMNYTYEDLDGQTAIISKAAQLASDKGMLVVSSAGNEGSYPWKYITVPSDVEDVLVVGSVSAENKVANSSSRGPTADGRIKPDVMARGVSTTVYHSSNMIGSNSGTSFSAPLITGFAAGLWQRHPELTNLELKEMIMDSGDKAHNPNNQSGHGLPDYVVATTGERILSVNDVFTDKLAVYPNPFSGDLVFVKIERKFAKSNLRFQLYDPKGRLVNELAYSDVKAGEILELDVASQSMGIFLLQIASGSETKNVRLLRY